MKFAITFLLFSCAPSFAATAGVVTFRQTFGETTAYTILELSAAGVPCRLNNLGDVVGKAGDSPSGEIRATIWNHGSLRPTNLGNLGRGESRSASGINDAGEVAGAANTAKSIVPFVRTPTGGLRRIPLLPGDNCGQALAINKYGHVAGYSSGSTGSRGFISWRKNGAKKVKKMFLTSGTQILSLGFGCFGCIDATSDRRGVTTCSSSTEALLVLFRAVQTPINCIALLCGHALDCSLVCERPGPCYGRAVFIGDGLAVQGSPCSYAPDGQGVMVALVQRRRQPHALGSINKHEHSGYACRSKHFLFRPCLSEQWTALRSRWAHRQLGRPAQRLHV